ncbi:MAG: hypothetical protein ACLTAI_07900 [Thomasclavelia sp.]
MLLNFFNYDCQTSDSFEAFQNCIDDYFTLGFKIGLDFDTILNKYAHE